MIKNLGIMMLATAGMLVELAIDAVLTPFRLIPMAAAPVGIVAFRQGLRDYRYGCWTNLYGIPLCPQVQGDLGSTELLERPPHTDNRLHIPFLVVAS